MVPLLKAIRTFSDDLLTLQDGSSAVEWGILASSIAAVVIVTIASLGQRVSTLYQSALGLLEAFL